jgi:hypothetical protein
MGAEKFEDHRDSSYGHRAWGLLDVYGYRGQLILTDGLTNDPCKRAEAGASAPGSMNVDKSHNI